MNTRFSLRLAALLILPILLSAAVPAGAAQAADFSISVANITMITKPPTCEARATKKRMTSGGTLSIVWKSDDADHMESLIRGGSTWPANGRERVSIAVAGKHVFPLTFTGPGGTVTCPVTVFVHPKKVR